MASKKPSSNEEEYFARQEAEKARQRCLTQTKALGLEEREQLKTRHFMRCPKCGLLMSELELRGVQVERCFGCNGIFLDEADIKELIEPEGYWARMLHVFAKGSYGPGEQK